MPFVNLGDVCQLYKLQLACFSSRLSRLDKEAAQCSPRRDTVTNGIRSPALLVAIQIQSKSTDPPRVYRFQMSGRQGNQGVEGRPGHGLLGD